MLKEFRDFILRGNVIDLAVGIVIGAAFGATVTSFVSNVLTPLLGTTTFGGMAIDALTYVALGGLYGASLYIARAADPRAARAEVDVVLETLISGLLGGATS